MKNFLKKLSFKNLQKSLKEAFVRFPLSFMLVVFIFGILEFLILQDNFLLNTTEELLIKGVLSLSVIYFLSIGVYLFSEKLDFNRLKTCLLQGLVIVFGLLFFFSFPENLFNNFFAEEIVYIIITFIGVISFIFISPFLKKLVKKEYNNDKYYTYFTELFSKIIMAIIVGLFLMLLGFLALASIFALFELSFLDEGKTFGFWAAFSLSLFAPLYFLSIAPIKEINLVLFDNIKENKFFNFLVNFIFLPAIIVYFLILYSYTGKVLLNFSDWPEGIISWMIIGFSLLGYLIYIVSYVFEEKLSLVRVFRKVLPFAILFQTPMLFYAIYLRINQYDFTINRYLVVVFGIFLFFISVYFIFSKIKKILYIPTSLTIFIIIISIGPWGVYQFPESRQLNLLKEDLIKAKILQNNNIIIPKNDTDIDVVLSGKIYEKVSYLCDFHGCDSMNEFFSQIIQDIKLEDEQNWNKNHLEQIKKYNEELKKQVEIDKYETKIDTDYLDSLEKEIYLGINSWEFKAKLIEKLKVKAYYSGKIENKYIDFYSKVDFMNSFIEVKNYDYMIGLISSQDLTNSLEQKSLYVGKIDINLEKLFIYKNKEILEEFDLKQDFKNFLEKHKNSINSFSSVELDKIIEIEKTGKKVDIKILMNSFSILNPNYTGKDILDNYGYVNGNILIKEK